MFGVFYFYGMKNTAIAVIVALAAVFFPFSAHAAQGLRIISLTPATTEILFALGLDEEIVGVTVFCNYPVKATLKEKVGSFSSPDIEKILYLKPDIIFATGMEQAPQVSRLRKLGLKVCISDPANLEGLFGSISEIGSLTHREKEADKLISGMRARIEAVRSRASRVSPDKRLRVFLEIWQDPMISVGKKSFVNELIALSGGVNISGDLPKAYSYFSPEQVIRRDPQCIIIGHRVDDAELEAVKRRFGWDRVSAVTTGRIYADINPDIILRPGPRLAEGLESIQERLYPVIDKQ